MIVGKLENLGGLSVTVDGRTYDLAENWTVVEGEWPYKTVDRGRLSGGMTVVLHGPPKAEKVHAVRIPAPPAARTPRAGARPAHGTTAGGGEKK